MPTVHLPASLRPLAKGAARLEVTAGPLQAVLDQCCASAPELRGRVLTQAGALQTYVRVFVDGVDVRDLTTPVAATAEVRLLTAFAGG